MSGQERFLWDEAAIDRLKLLWSRELSCADIASDMSRFFGRKLERNGVIGKAHRLGLKSRGNPVTRRPETVAKKAGPKPKPKREVKPAEPKAPKPINAASYPSAPKKAPAQPDKRVGKMTFAEVLDRDGCRWPYGDKPRMTFCGDTKQAPTEACQRPSYCRTHMDIAHRPVQAEGRR